MTDPASEIPSTGTVLVEVGKRRVARVVMSRGCTYSFPPICSVHGETLHNPFYENTIDAGDWFVLDSGAETPYL